MKAQKKISRAKIELIEETSKIPFSKRAIINSNSKPYVVDANQQTAEKLKEAKERTIKKRNRG